MPVRSALVIGCGIAGLVTALRLRRSDWEVVLLEHDETPADLPFVLRGAGHDAARRLGLTPALAERSGAAFPVLSQTDVLAVLRAALIGVRIRHDIWVAALAPDDCGVTAAFSSGHEDWFDLVVADVTSSGSLVLPHVGDALGRIVLIGDLTAQRRQAAARDLYTAELLGDALDIFPDAATAVRWWESRRRPVVRRERRSAHAVSAVHRTTRKAETAAKPV